MTLPKLNWKRVAVVVGGGIAAAVTSLIPATAVITLPVLGAVNVTAIVGAVSAYLFGTATRTPGTKPKTE